LASRALPRAEDTATVAKVAKTPMMAMTIRSSMRVKAMGKNETNFCYNPLKQSYNITIFHVFNRKISLFILIATIWIFVNLQNRFNSVTK